MLPSRLEPRFYSGQKRGLGELGEPGKLHSWSHWGPESQAGQQRRVGEVVLRSDEVVVERGLVSGQTDRPPAPGVARLGRRVAAVRTVVATAGVVTRVACWRTVTCVRSPVAFNKPCQY